MIRRLVPIALLVVAAAALVAVVDRSGGGRRPARPMPAHTPVVVPRPRRRHVLRSLPTPPAQVRGEAARRMAIPILTYHVIATAPPRTAYPDLWVRPAAFTSEIDALRRAGYWAVTLRRAYDGWESGAPLPRKPIVISFDDGYRGDYTHARSALRALGWPGVLNLELNNVRRGDLTASEVRALIRAGWEVDSHTLTHPDLTTVSDAQLQRELVGSKRELRSRFGVPADFFCYPAGRYDGRVEAAVKAAGYLAATTTDEGVATARSELFALPRVRVDSSDTARTLLARLAADQPH